ncbi:MAG: YkgJ family cysteine cluster protein [Leptospirales bacterium]
MTPAPPPDFLDPALPTLNIGHPAIMNVRGEEVVIPEGLLEKALQELEALEGIALSDFPSRETGLERLRQIFSIVDRVGDAVSSGMSCHSGCASCCRVIVATTRGESELLRERVRTHPESDKVRWSEGILQRNDLLEELSRTRNPPADLGRLEGLIDICEPYEKENQACPFLGPDRMCQVYEDRPLLCRICWVLTDPKDCEPGEGPPVKFRTAVFHRAHEIVGKISQHHFLDDRVSPIPYWFRDAQGD